MKLKDVPTPELKRMATATERTVGAEAPQVRAMQRELKRREQQGDQPTASTPQAKASEAVGI